MRDTFSEREQKILKVLGRRNMSLKQISDAVFEGVRQPFDATISINNSIGRIIKKCEYHSEINFTLRKSRVNKILFIKKVR